mmetsp:Transcript_316/g.1093  ORF Transcript_316/g.1093 Transcript_316/m.1093 type:complete len:280 (-) Transcript_316:1967-2806(-)
MEKSPAANWVMSFSAVRPISPSATKAMSWRVKRESRTKESPFSVTEEASDVRPKKSESNVMSPLGASKVMSPLVAVKMRSSWKPNTSSVATKPSLFSMKSEPPSTVTSVSVASMWMAPPWRVEAAAEVTVTLVSPSMLTSPLALLNSTTRPKMVVSSPEWKTRGPAPVTVVPREEVKVRVAEASMLKTSETLSPVLIVASPPSLTSMLPPEEKLTSPSRDWTLIRSSPVTSMSWSIVKVIGPPGAEGEKLEETMSPFSDSTVKSPTAVKVMSPVVEETM